MPNSVVRSIAKRTGKSEGEVEGKWQQAKRLTAHQYPHLHSSDDQYWAIVNSLTHKLSGVKESMDTGKKTLKQMHPNAFSISKDSGHAYYDHVDHFKNDAEDLGATVHHDGDGTHTATVDGEEVGKFHTRPVQNMINGYGKLEINAGNGAPNTMGNDDIMYMDDGSGAGAVEDSMSTGLMGEGVAPGAGASDEAGEVPENEGGEAPKVKVSDEVEERPVDKEGIAPNVNEEAIPTADGATPGTVSGAVHSAKYAAHVASKHAHDLAATGATVGLEAAHEAAGKAHEAAAALESGAGKFAHSASAAAHHAVAAGKPALAKAAHESAALAHHAAASVASGAAKVSHEAAAHAHEAAAAAKPALAAAGHAIASGAHAAVAAAAAHPAIAAGLGAAALGAGAIAAIHHHEVEKRMAHESVDFEQLIAEELANVGDATVVMKPFDHDDYVQLVADVTGADNDEILSAWNTLTQAIKNRSPDLDPNSEEFNALVAINVIDMFDDLSEVGDESTEDDDEPETTEDETQTEAFAPGLANSDNGPADRGLDSAAEAPKYVKTGNEPDDRGGAASEAPGVAHTTQGVEDRPVQDGFAPKSKQSGEEVEERPEDGEEAPGVRNTSVSADNRGGAAVEAPAVKEAAEGEDDENELDDTEAGNDKAAAEEENEVKEGVTRKTKAKTIQLHDAIKKLAALRLRKHDIVKQKGDTASINSQIKAQKKVVQSLRD